VHSFPLVSSQRAWLRHLRNASTLARIRILSCLQQPECYDIVGIGEGGDETMGFDNIAEHAIVEYLQNFESFTLVSEEAGVQIIGSNPNGFVILDPIDGSKNLSQGLHLCCIAIAFGTKLTINDIEVAVILDIFSGRCYHAIRREGAYRDFKRIKPAVLKQLDECIVGVDSEFPAYRTMKASSKLQMQRIRYTRHLGSNALELCYVADGTIDGFVDLRGVFRGTDLAAASLILQEAGATIIDEKGQVLAGKCTNDETYSLVAACDSQLAKQLLQLANSKTK
jgi:myo-inositol-1(or 4)-monophosphatase